MASGGTAVCSEDSPDVWSLVECGQLEKGEHTDLDLLMPNGFLISVRCHSDSTLAMLKQEVFNEAKRYVQNSIRISSIRERSVI